MTCAACDHPLPAEHLRHRDTLERVCGETCAEAIDSLQDNRWERARVEAKGRAA